MTSHMTASKPMTYFSTQMRAATVALNLSFSNQVLRLLSQTYQRWLPQDDISKASQKIRLECSVIPLTIRCPGSCTIAIVNIVDIPRGILPAQSSEPVPRSDAGQLGDFKDSIVALRGRCVGEEKQAGWAVAGK